MRCPYCTKEFSPGEAFIESDWRDIINMLPEFGPHARLAFEYAEKFGVTPVRIRTRKLRRLLSEIKSLFHQERFSFRRREYAISRPGIAEALKIVCSKHFEQPLENHNYLKKVMISISEREEKERSAAAEKALRKKEERIMSGVKDQAGEYVSAAEYKRKKGIESLAGIVGKGMK